VETAVNKTTLLAEILRLPEHERRELVEEVVESLEPDALVSAEQAEEIERRIDQHERDPSEAKPWDEVREWLWSRRK
jgi:putative addiction module component (TIGR02574 family)